MSGSKKLRFLICSYAVMTGCLAVSYVHRLDPFAIRFTEGFGIRWYGLAYFAGFVIGWLLIRWLARTRRCALASESVFDLLFYLIVGVLAGGRLGYIIFYEPRLFIDPPLIGIVQIWRGGMASHGGMIGAIVGCVLFARKRSIPTLHLLDIGALCAPPGLALGRIANFINAELWGKPLPEGLQANPPWWSVKYPEEILRAGFPYLEKLEPLRDLVAGAVPFPESVVLAVREGREGVIEAVRPYLTAFYPSQIFQAIAEGPVLMGLVALFWLFPLRPGCAAGGFLAGYGILRIATETFRQPDPGVALLSTVLGDLSRGQALSVVMVLAGIALAILGARSKTKPLGCLRPSRLEG